MWQNQDTRCKIVETGDGEILETVSKRWNQKIKWGKYVYLKYLICVIKLQVVRYYKRFIIFS